MPTCRLRRDSSKLWSQLFLKKRRCFVRISATMTSMVTPVTIHPEGLSPAPVGSTERLEVHLGFREGGEVGTLWGLFEGVPFKVNSG